MLLRKSLKQIATILQPLSKINTIPNSNYVNLKNALKKHKHQHNFGLLVSL